MQQTESVRTLADTVQVETDSLFQGLADAVSRAVPGLGTSGGQAAERAIRDGVESHNVSGEAAIAVGDSLSGGLWSRVVDGAAGVTGSSRVIAADLILTFAFVLALLAVRSLVLFVVRRRSTDPRVFYQWRKGSSYIAIVVGFFVLARIWFGALGSFVTFLGLLSAGIAIALREPLVNMAAWVFILWRRPFAVGDRITLRTHVGDVIDQRVFQFTMLEVVTATGAMQSTGRIVHIPNGWIFTDSIVNHTSAFAYIWNEIAVTVTFESDWRAAKEALFKIAHDCADHLSEDAARTLRRAARDYFIFYTTLTPTVYTSVLAHGIQLTIRYLVDPRRVRNSEESVWEAVLDEFVPRTDIFLAYPTSRIFRSSEESMHSGPKPDVRYTQYERGAPAGRGTASPDGEPLPEAPGSGT